MIIDTITNIIYALFAIVLINNVFKSHAIRLYFYEIQIL